MAKSNVPGIEPGATYRVALTKSIKVGRMHLHPGPNVKMRGDVLAAQIKADASAISGYERATLPGE